MVRCACGTAGRGRKRVTGTSRYFCSTSVTADGVKLLVSSQKFSFKGRSRFMKYVRWARAACAVAAMFALVCASSREALAQSTTAGAIGGQVSDQSKAAIPGATVTARGVATNSSTDAVSDSNGRFTIINLNPGIYTVEVSLPGFAPYKRD